MITTLYAVLGLLLERWPAAQIILPGETVIHGHEFTVLLPCKCFMSVYVSSPVSWGIIFSMLERGENQVAGYRNEKEYEIFSNIIAHRCVICLNDVSQPGQLLAEWSLFELIEDIERLTACCASNKEKVDYTVPF